MVFDFTIASLHAVVSGTNCVGVPHEQRARLTEATQGPLPALGAVSTTYSRHPYFLERPLRVPHHGVDGAHNTSGVRYVLVLVRRELQ